jgi:hypothetical protein
MNQLHSDRKSPLRDFMNHNSQNSNVMTWILSMYTIIVDIDFKSNRICSRVENMQGGEIQTNPKWNN